MDTNVKQKELHTVAFHRAHLLKRPSAEDLPTLEDADEHKLAGMDKLLRQMHDLHAALSSVGLALKEEARDRYPQKNLYELTDAEYADFPEFKIRIKSDWLDPKYGIALHGGFKFQLYVMQDGYGGRHEIADWINIHIQHLYTTPMAWASTREHVRTLGFFLKGPTYFHDIPMEFATHVSGGRIKDGFTFKTAAFNQAVDDACTVMRKIISRKEHLRAFTE